MHGHRTRRSFTCASGARPVPNLTGSLRFLTGCLTGCASKKTNVCAGPYGFTAQTPSVRVLEQTIPLICRRCMPAGVKIGSSWRRCQDAPVSDGGGARHLCRFAVPSFQARQVSRHVQPIRTLKRHKCRAPGGQSRRHRPITNWSFSTVALRTFRVMIIR